ncbi:MAG: 30S ribosome-binding factor RbfA [Planctomycetes bacterium]|nr:30S ribosome-binding factor RbfA [Planctomycetota bacterium]
MNERRIERIQNLIRQRVAKVLDQELADPRRGFVTVTRVKVDREMQQCTVFWSIIGDDKARRLNEQMLADAAPFVQREVAAILHTRNVPHVRFRYDESLAGAQRLDELLTELRIQRGDGPEPPTAERDRPPVAERDTPPPRD